MLAAILATLCACIAVSQGFGCVDDNGNNVAWWLAVKMPSGYKYLLATPSATTLKQSSFVMDDPSDGALSNTMNQIWQSGSQYVAFNDNPAKPDMFNMTDIVDETELGNLTSGATAHSKGLLAFNGGQGFWLTHSVPNFPLMPTQVSSYQGLSSNAGTYGQHLFCVTMTEAQLDQVAGQIVIDAPDVYSSYFTSATLNKYDGFRDLVEENYPSTAECVGVVVGPVVVFGKTQTWGKDLWASCVSPYYKTSLYVETWLRGLEIGSSCPPSFPYETLDVEYVTFGSFGWKETVDHAKWGVGVDKDVVCFGDINRMTSQFARGGGATCFSNAALAGQFRTAVTTHTTC